jgi:predicted nuclease of predicted toxin-antitoxin system
LRLLLDEHYSRSVARELRNCGYDVVAVAEERDLRGAADSALFSWARENRRAIVTQDVRDFVAIARGAAVSETDHCGIVFTSPRAFPPAAEPPG